MARHRPTGRNPTRTTGILPLWSNPGVLAGSVCQSAGIRLDGRNTTKIVIGIWADRIPVKMTGFRHWIPATLTGCYRISVLVRFRWWTTAWTWRSTVLFKMTRMRLVSSENDLRFSFFEIYQAFLVKQKSFFGWLLFSPLPNTGKCQNHFTLKQTEHNFGDLSKF